MKWRVMVELIGGDGSVCTHEIGSDTAECSAAAVGLTLADGKRILAALQRNLVRGQAEEYCRQRRVCSHCRSQRPLRNVSSQRWGLCCHIAGPGHCYRTSCHWAKFLLWRRAGGGL